MLTIARDKTKPLYQTIADDLMRAVESGDVDYETPLCTERSICAQYGVSRITAKRAIEMLEHDRVLYRKRGVGSFAVPRAAHAQQPLPQPSAEASRKVTLVIPFNYTNGGLLQTVEPATTLLARYNCYIALSICKPSPESERQALSSVLDAGTSGLVFYPSGGAIHEDILEKYAKYGLPVVILDKPHAFEQYSSVVCDNFYGGYLITEHLVSYGHEKTCYLSRYEAGQISSIRDRYNGYASCLEGMCPGAAPKFTMLELKRDEPIDFHMLKHVINKLHREGVTAVLCENDEVAFYVYMCCAELSISVPGEMSVAGFDNIEWAVAGNMQITTVDQRFDLIGEAAASLLTQSVYAPRHVKVPVRLVPRLSTAPVRPAPAAM